MASTSLIVWCAWVLRWKFCACSGRTKVAPSKDIDILLLSRKEDKVMRVG